MSSDVTPPSLADDAAAPAGRPSTVDVVELPAGVIDLARSAAIGEAATADHVGPFASAVAEDDIGVTASFVARQPGYVGWHWSVTLAIVDGAPATVSEVVLLPGEGSLLAPAWVPWDQRIRPGDVGVGDLLPPIEDDPRLVPAYRQSDDPAVEAVAAELGLGRVHVLSREGRVDFAERLHDSTFGPTGELALAAPAHCFSCAFYLPLAGSLGQLLGACSNEYSPADRRVVDAGFGCGAHSETVIEMPARSATTLAVIDELSLEVHRRPASTMPDAGVSAAAVPGDGLIDAVVVDDSAPLHRSGIDSTGIDSTEIDSPMPDADPAPEDTVPDADPVSEDTVLDEYTVPDEDPALEDAAPEEHEPDPTDLDDPALDDPALDTVLSTTPSPDDEDDVDDLDSGPENGSPESQQADSEQADPHSISD